MEVSRLHIPYSTSPIRKNRFYIQLNRFVLGELVDLAVCCVDVIFTYGPKMIRKAKDFTDLGTDGQTKEKASAESLS